MRWTKKEDNIFIENEGELTASEIQKMLPHRRLTSIYIRSYQLDVQLKAAHGNTSMAASVMKYDSKNGLIPVTAPMPPELEKRARIYAAQLGISRAEVVRRAVESFLDEVALERIQ